MNLGVLLRELGREAEAQDAFRKVLKLDPEHPLAAQRLAEAA